MNGVEDNKLEQLLEALLEGDAGRTESALEALQSGREDHVLTGPVVERAVNTAALLLTMGQSEQACIMLEALVDRCGADTMLLNNLAFAHLVGGRPERAVELLEQAVALEPDNKLIAGNLARARSKLPDSDQN